MSKPSIVEGISDSSEAKRLIPFLRERFPSSGLFADQSWKIARGPLPLPQSLLSELEFLGRILVQFYKAINLLYRQSLEGKQPPWIAALLDQGKPESLKALQQSSRFKNEIPRVIRPDLLLTDQGLSLTELDSVPGGIGLTAWLNQSYDQFAALSGTESQIVGGSDQMISGFAGIFSPDAKTVHLVVSDEAASYRPEMEWLATQLGPRFRVQDGRFNNPSEGDAVYRFFELFDLPNIPGAELLLQRANQSEISITPPPKPIFEEKLNLALLWNRNLNSFWRQQLGGRFFEKLQQIVPYSWVVDPAPLPPHAGIPRLDLAHWNELKELSQKDRELILKISGFSEKAWGSRGVFLGSDLSQGDWAAAVEKALADFHTSPHILQAFTRPKQVRIEYWDEPANAFASMNSRVRLCPYYFVRGSGDQLRAELCGILATCCPADKKIIHGMKDAVLAPCAKA